jgi:glucose uptake protein GlcU
MGEGVGFICAAISVVAFGSNFVPVKKFETGDGMFFQWIMCTAIWLAGFLVNVIQGFPKFEPLAMLGGFLWCTGNVMVVQIVKMIGLGLGLLLWGSSNLIMGWCSGTFGLFGLTANKANVPWLNYLGFVLAVASSAIYIFVKSEGTPQKRLEEDPEYKSLINEEQDIAGSSWVDKLSDKQKRIVGIVLSLISGIFYGVNFDPPTYVMDHGGSKNGLDYVFSHFCGIYITSTLYFLIYCAAMRSKPILYPQIVLPGILTGGLWALADICWFVANAQLGLNTAFPIITTGPGVVASLWGILHLVKCVEQEISLYYCAPSLQPSQL